MQTKGAFNRAEDRSNRERPKAKPNQGRASLLEVKTDKKHEENKLSQMSHKHKQVEVNGSHGLDFLLTPPLKSCFKARDNEEQVMLDSS